MGKVFKRKRSDLPRRRTLQPVENTSMTSQHVFKRNRTLAGTSINRFDELNSGDDQKSTRSHVHSLSIRRRKIVAVLVIVILAAVPIWLLISNFTASVSVDFTNTGISTSINKQTYEKAIQDYLDDNPISRLNFFLSQSSLSNYVSVKLPEVSAVSQGNMTGIGATDFAVTLRTPVASWQIGDKQYYVDSSGIPFDTSYFNLPLVEIIDNSGVSYKIGTTAIASNRFLSFVGQVVSSAKVSGYVVTQASLPPDTTRELEIRLQGVSYYVTMSIDRPAGEQVQDMVNAMGYFATNKQTPKYIDVRVSGKAFYELN